MIGKKWALPGTEPIPGLKDREGKKKKKDEEKKKKKKKKMREKKSSSPQNRTWSTDTNGYQAIRLE